MSKKIKLIIKKSDTKLGKKGNIIKVSQGYAFNYLIPKNLAEILTPGQIKHLAMIQKIETSKIKLEQEKASILQKNLERIDKISITKKSGKKNRIFGSINEKEIIEQLYKYTGEKLEKKQLIIQEIKEVGTYHIQMKIFNNMMTACKLQVLPANIKLNF